MCFVYSMLPICRFVQPKTFIFWVHKEDPNWNFVGFQGIHGNSPKATWKKQKEFKQGLTWTSTQTESASKGVKTSSITSRGRINGIQKRTIHFLLGGEGCAKLRFYFFLFGGALSLKHWIFGWALMPKIIASFVVEVQFSAGFRRWTVRDSSEWRMSYPIDLLEWQLPKGMSQPGLAVCFLIGLGFWAGEKKKGTIGTSE